MDWGCPKGSIKYIGSSVTDRTAGQQGNKQYLVEQYQVEQYQVGQ